MQVSGYLYRVIGVFLIFFCFATNDGLGQDSIPKLKFNGDFRFRIEPDWDSRKSDGSFREDRTRLRYRARFGMAYQHQEWLSLGMRIRTGLQNKQQDPQLTLGDGFNEFGTLPIAFEKIYALFDFKNFSAWVGKNTFPFQKQNELFWSDNVYPEGIAIQSRLPVSQTWIESIGFSAGHFISRANGSGLDSDSYFQGIQFVTTHWDDRVTFFPAIFFFNDIPNIPDGNETFTLDYNILHLGTRVEVLKEAKLGMEFDYYSNLTSYTANDSIAPALQNQKQGYTASIRWGELVQQGDWQVRVTYNQQERFSAVDFFAQNDWARWDYANLGSPDGRLTNYKGWEFMAGYTIRKKVKVKMRYFRVKQLVPLGLFLETGQRVRFDIDIGF